MDTASHRAFTNGSLIYKEGYTLYEDTVTGTRIYSLEPTGLLRGEIFPSEPKVSLDVTALCQGNDTQLSLVVRTHYQNGTPFNTEPALLLVVIDGEAIVLPEGECKKVVEGNAIIEALTSPISKEQLGELAEASEVSLCLYGSETTLIRRLDDEHIDIIEAFYKRVIVTDTFPPPIRLKYTE